MKYNINYLYSQLFVKQLAILGVRHVCISPGSRSTPLTLAFAKEKRIKKHVIIDERGSAFFALGIAKQTHEPVALVCTSGTAALEYYPAIAEAYRFRVPLIICTTDRPEDAFLFGANQTINQNNLYGNHVRAFFNATLPSKKNFQKIINISFKAWNISSFEKGPVHINFPFDKPLEPFTYTHDDKSEVFKNLIFYKRKNQEFAFNINKNIIKAITKSNKGLIFVGPKEYEIKELKAIIKIAELLKYPIIAEPASNLFSANIKSRLLIENSEILLRIKVFDSDKTPETILHFGNTMTSTFAEEFLKRFEGNYYVINKHSDKFDPTKKAKVYLGIDEVNFYNSIKNIKHSETEFTNSLIKLDRELAEKKKIFLDNQDDIELKVLSYLFDNLPEKSSLFLSNSLSIRDFNFMTKYFRNKVKVFCNRGVSGIDGIISTALGTNIDKEVSVLLTGDLAYYYDINSLLIAKQECIPLIVILINNNGGGIFTNLPINNLKDDFDKYFLTSHNLDLKSITNAFGHEHKFISNVDEFHTSFRNAILNKSFTVLEIKTTPESSKLFKQNFYKSLGK